MYQSSATVLVKPLNPNQILQGYSYSFSVSMQTEQALATSPAVAEIAAGNAPGDGVDRAATQAP